MGWRVVVQPDDKLAIWSTVVDDWIAVDATEEEIAKAFVDDAAETAKENAARAIVRARDRGVEAWRECEEDRERVHGAK